MLARLRHQSSGTALERGAAPVKQKLPVACEPPSAAVHLAVTRASRPIFKSNSVAVNVGSRFELRVRLVNPAADEGAEVASLGAPASGSLSVLHDAATGLPVGRNLLMCYDKT